MQPVTDVSEAVSAAPDAPPARPPGRGGRTTALLASLAALIAIVCGAALPFAPVLVNEPTVSWPQDPARPESTLLTLTAYRPLAMDVTFGCDAARLAATSGGTIVSTALPAAPLAGTTGMIARGYDGRVEIRAFDRVLLDEPLPPGPCTYRIAGQSKGVPSFVRPLPDPADFEAPKLSNFAAPDQARLVISRDGQELATATNEQLPDVDALATDLTALPPGQLSVDLRVDDEFTSSPAPLKALLIGMLVAALLATGVLLWRLDRQVARVPRAWRPAWPRVVDVVVPAVIVFWMFVAPETDDDGYYAIMAHNSALSGEVGNYYQLYDQNFTPFTWFYQALGWWQQLVGTAPVLQRIPAVVFGIVTWLVLRRFVTIAMRDWAPGDRWWVRTGAHAVLAVVYLAWWIPLDMGVRPETVVAMCGAAAMLLVLGAARRQRIGLAWLAVAVAALGFTAHPTGFTLFAPLLAGLPLLWPVIRVAGDRLGTTLRALAVLSGGMVAPLMAFADGALRDFVRGQAIFLSLQGQEGWTTEIQRYWFLLAQIPMGNFAKRAPVLCCLVALVWFAVLVVAARLRKVSLPAPLWLAGSTTALAFATLWLTPSKWTHHFGALAGVGPVFLALLLVTAVPLTREVLRGSRLSIGVLAAAGASFVVAITLSWHGPNQWPYAFMDGMRRPNLPPAVSRISFDNPVWWVLGTAVAGLVLALWFRRRGLGGRFGALWAVPLVVAVALVGTTGYTVLTFGLGAAKGVPAESIWAQSLADPGASRCGAAAAVQVLDPRTARPLPSAAGPPAAAPDGFVEGSGYYLGNQPQGPGAGRLWGSLVARDGRTAEGNVASMTTGWYALPRDLPQGAATTVLAAGALTQGNSLTAEYAGADGAPAGTEELDDGVRDPSWRTLTLDPPAGAELVRLHAVDGETALHGWLAFAAPALASPVALADYLPRDAPVGLAWQLAFGYPCQRQPIVLHGITETPAYAVLYGGGSMSGFADGTWQTFRGGAFAQVPRVMSVQQLAVLPGVDPNIWVYAFDTELARDAYTLTETTRSVGGATAASS